MNYYPADLVSNAKTVITKARNPGLDALSRSSRITAFFLAVSRFKLDEAKMILDAGANPLLFCDKKYDP